MYQRGYNQNNVLLHVPNWAYNQVVRGFMENGEIQLGGGGEVGSIKFKGHCNISSITQLLTLSSIGQ